MLISEFVVTAKLLYHCTEYEIIPPKSLNVSVGERADFTCVFNFTLDFVVWYLDSTPINYFVDLHVEEYFCLGCQPISSGVRIFASAEQQSLLDNITVHCLAINVEENLSKLTFSLPAVLRVQGEKYNV